MATNKLYNGAMYLTIILLSVNAMILFAFNMGLPGVSQTKGDLLIQDMCNVSGGSQDVTIDTSEATNSQKDVAAADSCKADLINQLTILSSGWHGLAGIIFNDTILSPITGLFDVLLFIQAAAIGFVLLKTVGTFLGAR